jgi:hypothetical protein
VNADWANCRVDGCPNPSRTSGRRNSDAILLCSTHYARHRRGTPLGVPVGQLLTAGERSEDGSVVKCCKCLTWKPASDEHFYINRRTLMPRLQCKACCRRRYEADKGRWYLGRLRLMYGLTKAQYEAMVSSQGGACAICRVQEKRLVVDHDHSCCPGEKTCGKCLRGLLCHACNQGIGKLHDSPKILRSAAEYVESYANASATGLALVSNGRILEAA